MRHRVRVDRTSTSAGFHSYTNTNAVGRLHTYTYPCKVASDYLSARTGGCIDVGAVLEITLANAADVLAGE